MWVDKFFLSTLPSQRSEVLLQTDIRLIGGKRKSEAIQQIHSILVTPAHLESYRTVLTGGKGHVCCPGPLLHGAWDDVLIGSWFTQALAVSLSSAERGDEGQEHFIKEVEVSDNGGKIDKFT
jgi:hypothetical protein